MKVDASEVGLAVARIGGGRARVEDEIDPAVGFLADVKLGEEVRAGQTLGTLLCRDEAKGREAAARVRSAYTVGDAPPPTDSFKLIKEVIAE